MKTEEDLITLFQDTLKWGSLDEFEKELGSSKVKHLGDFKLDFVLRLLEHISPDLDFSTLSFTASTPGSASSKKHHSPKRRKTNSNEVYKNLLNWSFIAQADILLQARFITKFLKLFPQVEAFRLLLDNVIGIAIDNASKVRLSPRLNQKNNIIICQCFFNCCPKDLALQDREKIFFLLGHTPNQKPPEHSDASLLFIHLFLTCGQAGNIPIPDFIFDNAIQAIKSDAAIKTLYNAIFSIDDVKENIPMNVKEEIARKIQEKLPQAQRETWDFLEKKRQATCDTRSIFPESLSLEIHGHMCYAEQKELISAERAQIQRSPCAPFQRILPPPGSSTKLTSIMKGGARLTTPQGGF